MAFRLSSRSLARLDGVHPDLIRVVKRAIQITPVDFGITEGLRTKERQKELVAKGASRTLKSRHLTGHAVDVVAYIGSEVRSCNGAGARRPMASIVSSTAWRSRTFR